MNKGNMTDEQLTKRALKALNIDPEDYREAKQFQRTGVAVKRKTTAKTKAPVQTPKQPEPIIKKPDPESIEKLKRKLLEAQERGDHREVIQLDARIGVLKEFQREAERIAGKYKKDDRY